MQAQQLIQWAVCAGIACVIFTSITGIQARFWRRENRQQEFDQLKQRVERLEKELQNVVAEKNQLL